MTVHWVEQRFKASKSLKDRYRSRRPPVISQDIIQKLLERRRPMPENDKAAIEEENFCLHRIQDGQKDGREKSETFQETSSWVQQGLKSVWRRAPVCWTTWRITGIESSFFPMRKHSPLILSSTNRIIGS